MTPEIAGSKWIEGLYHDTPCVVAARIVLNARLHAVGHMMELAAAPPDNDTEYVHQLRVSSRRADAALRLFRPFFRPRACKSARASLRDVRKAAALARNDDVHLDTLEREAARMPAGAARALQVAREFLAASRTGSQDRLVSAGRRFSAKQWIRELAGNVVFPNSPGQASTHSVTHMDAASAYSLGALCHAELPRLIELFAESVQADPDEAAALHQLRIVGKKLRYTLELLACCLPRDATAAVYRELTKMQSRLGRLNDFYEIAERFDKCAGRRKGTKPNKADSNGRANQGPAEDWVALTGYFRDQHERYRRRFAHWFDALRQKKILDAAAALLSPVQPTTAARESSTRTSSGDVPVASRTPDASLRPSRNRRVAAIDIGTNSIRMAVAETDPAIGFRIIEDVKETTRLGAGVFSSGKLKVGAVKRSLTALERMRAVAENYRVDSLRAVATSAVREAANGPEFVKLIRRRVGIPIEVIQPQREARLAFAGVARDFDLTDNRVAVVDTGGGSTEVVFATTGVIDAIRPVRLGAVRLTETFGDPAEPGQYQYREMRKRIEKTIRESIRRLPYKPDFIVGAGGTFTSLARVALRKGETDKGGRFPFAVRGCELRHKTVAHVLSELRRMSLEERSRISGLSAKRAEIIVAGLCIVERLMNHLQVDRLFIHDGGIRDGLVAELIDEMGFRCQPPRTHPEQVIGAVARYAERMRFPREHSEHVARLSLMIFDALVEAQPDAAGVWGKPANRDLLRGAALLHDVGHLIARKAHHKHAYDMILHADLSTLTRREIEIIANICRYHRKRGPRRKDSGFRRLGAEDQRVVAHLAGILRIADGFDYNQKQNVTDVRVRMNDDETVFEATGVDNIDVERKRAQQKSDVFESAFHTKVRCELQSARLAVQRA